MKKTTVLLLFITGVLLLPLPVRAQMKSFLVPGVNCGVANDIAKSRCCAPLEMGNDLFDALPYLGPGFNTLVDMIRGPAMSFINTSFSPIVEYQKKLSIPCESGTPSESDPSDPNCRCIATAPTPGPIAILKDYCVKLTGSSEQINCGACVNDGGVWTGIGCVQGDIKRFISETILGMGIGLAGGISLLCMIFAAFMMQTSNGSPEKLKKAQELLTACITGLILIIFSIFILRLIGVNILRIPGFSL